MKLNFQIKTGSRRVVFLIGKRVYKIPNPKRWVSFIRGIEENLEERYWWSADGSRKRDPERPWSPTLPLAEIHWADRFGFLLIMERLDTDFHIDGDVHRDKLVQVCHDFHDLKNQVKGYSFENDLNLSNVGYRGNQLLVLDYGYFGGTLDCYIGT